MTSVEPRDASSLIIVRGDADNASVLMGRRKANASFIPDAYVFPGGAIEPGDHIAQAVSPLRADTLDRMAQSSDPDHSQALAMAAVRETAEESGLMLGVPGEIGDADGEGWTAMRGYSLAPTLDCLDYLGRAITPEGRPKRFHARFFMVRAEHVVGNLGGDGELLDLRWVPLDDTGDLRIIDVTQFMLDEVRAIVTAGGDASRGRVFTYSQSGAQIDYD